MTRVGSGISRRELLAGLALSAAAASCASQHRRAGARSTPLVYDEHGGLFVEARVGGRGPVLLLLDTGASRSTVSTGFAARLGLPMRPGGEIEGSAGVVTAQEITADVEVAGLEPERVDLTVYEFASYEPRCVGILGYELLSRAPFEIRYAERRLAWNPTPPSRTIPMTLDGRIPRIEARVDGTSLDLRIDTGAAFPPGEDAYLNLTQDQAARIGLEGPPLKVFTATGTGDAVLELPVHPLHAIEVAGVRLERAFAIVQPRMGYFARADAVGFLGNSVLEKLDPFLDYSLGRFGVA